MPMTSLRCSRRIQSKELNRALLHMLADRIVFLDPEVDSDVLKRVRK